MKARTTVRITLRSLMLLVSLLSLMGCGTLELGIERTPTPDPAVAATVAALVAENARLATALARLATSTPLRSVDLGKLAYVQDGDIWVKVLPDGQPLRLTTDGRNRQPRWSPSGEWLAFRKSDYQVWVVRADGSDAHAASEGTGMGAFAWSPTADRLAHVTRKGELRAVNADGTHMVVLAPATGSGRVERFAWSSDGAWIAYDREELLEPTRGLKPPERYAGLWRVRADGRDAVELFGGKVVFGEATPADQTNPYGGAIVAVWSPDNSRILFWSDPFSAALLADGTSLVAIPANGGVPDELIANMLAYSDFLAPSPDGRFLAAIEGQGREAWTDKRLALVDLSRGILTHLTDDTVATCSVAWSPDSERIVYVAMPDLGEGHLSGGEPLRQALLQRRLFTINALGPLVPQQLTDDPAYRDGWPLWSADGEYILFSRLDSEDGASVWLIPADGGDAQQVVEELTPTPEWFGYYGHVDWDTFFDWWQRPVGQQRQPRATLVGPTPAATMPPDPAGWQSYSSSDFAVTLKYPAHWQHRPGYGESYGGEDGLFGLNAVSGEGVSLDEVAQRAAQHKLRPYGSQPRIESLEVQGQAARLILPSADQPQEMRGQAELIVLYPQPVAISGERYRYFVLYGDQGHIRQMAETLAFVGLGVPESALGRTRTYTDTALGFAVDYPGDWSEDGVRGGFAMLWDPATSGGEQQAIHIAALDEPSLEAMLHNLERGFLGPYVVSGEPTQLGGLEALRVILREAPEGLSLVWLVITPQGQGLTIAAYGDPALAEAIAVTWRAIPAAEAHGLADAFRAQELPAYVG